MADNTEIINCPACGKEMQKVFMPDQGVNLDVCINGCGGIYFDNREFNKFDEPHEDITPLLQIFEGKNFEKQDETQIRHCPVCGSKMVKNYASAKHEIQIDECYSCGGKFLDFKELEIIRNQYNSEAERAADVVNELYSAAGIEIHKFNEKYKSQLENSKSVISKLIRNKYNH